MLYLLDYFTWTIYIEGERESKQQHELPAKQLTTPLAEGRHCEALPFFSRLVSLHGAAARARAREVLTVPNPQQRHIPLTRRFQGGGGGEERARTTKPPTIFSASPCNFPSSYCIPYNHTVVNRWRARVPTRALSWGWVEFRENGLGFPDRPLSPLAP